MKQFKVAIVGCGNISRMHFEAYLPHPERMRIVAVCDADAERMHERQQEFHVSQGFTSLEEMIAQADWEIGIVCTPTHVRRQIVETLAAAGKQIFVEKPFADSYQDAEYMVDTCTRAGVSIAVNQNFRYHYPFDLAGEIVAQKSIGRVINIVHHDLMFRQDSGWRTQLPRHALSVMGVHWFDGFRRILHDEASSLVCEMRSSSAIECAGETEASTLINFKNGTLVSYMESFSSPIARTETLVLGETGALVLTYNGLSLYTLTNRTQPRQQWENPYRGTQKPAATFTGIDLFLQALEQHTESANSGRDNLKTIALLDAAYRSAQEGQTIFFDKGVQA